jgi:O-antigen biosynthesis protein WbqP
MKKRYLDIVISLIAALILLAPCLLVSLIILITSPGPVFHVSKRIGKNGNFFSMYKFRTMQCNTPQVASDKLVDAKKYITPFGSFLRKTSFDEVPQLIPVIMGNMSLVGPRPALFNQKKLFAERELLGINSLLPGITGLAQINGRDNISLDEKIKFDLEYLLKQSFLLDIKIIMLTIVIVLRRKGVTH